MIVNVVKSLSNLPGWRTKRNILVIESDDWGSVRMPSLKVYRHLQQLGLNIDKGNNQRYNTLDTLASHTDLACLFDTLRQVKDCHGHHPAFTAMSLGANPDFEKIVANGFMQYEYEAFTTTLERYGLSDTFAMWQQGADENLFHAEFHGREHLNIKVWMDALRKGDPHTRAAFEQGCWGFKPSNDYGISYQAAFDVDDVKTLPIQKAVVRSGVELFKSLHGRKPRFFVPPNGPIHQSIIDEAVTAGVEYVSSPKIHQEPQGHRRFKKRFRYLGKRGTKGMIYLTRNCFFEPSYQGKGFSVDDCLKQIKSAFQFRKPAIVSTHRVNYIGGLQESNRINGNQALAELFRRIVRQWPDVEFMTSPQLGDTIRNE